MSRHAKAVESISRHDMLPEVCPLAGHNMGASFFEAMDAWAATGGAQTYLSLYYTTCPICHDEDGKPHHHWAILHPDHVRMIGLVCRDHLSAYREEDRKGIFRVDLNVMCRISRYVDWLRAYSEWLQDHPVPEYFNEWQKP